MKQINANLAEEVTRTVSDPGYALYVSHPQTPKSLDEIKMHTDYFVPVDRHIEKIVKALVFLGVTTKSSCDGKCSDFFGTGNSGGMWLGQRPWVEFDSEDRQRDLLQTLIDRFNQTSEIKWRLLPISAGVHGIPLTTEKLAREAKSFREGDCGKHSLVELHESGERLAQFIFDAAKRLNETKTIARE